MAQRLQNQSVAEMPEKPLNPVIFTKPIEAKPASNNYRLQNETYLKTPDYKTNSFKMKRLKKSPFYKSNRSGNGKKRILPKLILVIRFLSFWICLEFSVSDLGFP
jgi:hypothetical protein